jgi:hypothetical protein
MSKQFKVGDKVRCVNDSFRKEFGLVNGALYAVAAIDRQDAIRLEGQPEHWAHVNNRFELVAPSGYYVVSSPLEQYRTQHATAEAAKTWITEVGEPGTVYTVHEVKDAGTFSVVRELKEAA